MELLNGWSIEFHSGIPVYKQIINRISAAVAGGSLKEGDQLPTIREMREALEVNPNTVAKAYRELELKGIISSQRGSGSFVAPVPGHAKLNAKQKKARVRQLVDRMKAEASQHGLELDDLLDHLAQRRKSHA